MDLVLILDGEVLFEAIEGYFYDLDDSLGLDCGAEGFYCYFGVVELWDLFLDCHEGSHCYVFT